VSAKAAFKRGDRVAGTINGHAFTAVVMGVSYARGKVFFLIRFDEQVDVLHGHVAEHHVTTSTVPDLRLVTA
jgi:hypothetical protein